jgi:enoyl-CoA hydratase/carnithine racemase
MPEQELESKTIAIAREIAARLAPLQHAKIAVQMGRDMTLSQAIQLDQLVGAEAKPRDRPDNMSRIPAVPEGRPERGVQAS